MEERSLWFDDDGTELHVGDWVDVNHEVRTTIVEIGGERYLKCWNLSDTITSIRKEA